MLSLSLELIEDYSLIGIHTSEEDYRLAYLLNKNLNTTFSKSKIKLDFKKGNATFTVFEFFDNYKQQEFFLISNKCIEKQSSPVSSDLFSDSINYSSTSYLISEKKQVDFFFKIKGTVSSPELKKIIDKLNNIQQIITSYNINPSDLKSGDYLIF